jgi:hypothetical protein
MIFKESITYGNKTSTYLVAIKNIEETIAFSDVQNPELEKIIGQNQLIDL